MLSRCQRASLVSKAASSSLHDIRLASITTTRRYNTSLFHTMSARRQPSEEKPHHLGLSTFENTPVSGSAWHTMLDDVDDEAPLKAKGREKAPTAPKPRQTMSERENRVLTDMLDMIFAPKINPVSTSTNVQPQAPAGPQDEVGPSQVNDLFGRLRRLSTRKPSQKARAATTELLDMKKEEMNACASDQELLEWAEREVFQESVRYEQAAKRAAAEAVQSLDGAQKRTSLPLQSPIYPQMIAHLMRTFRENYRNPNLALYIFHYTQKLSIVSYTFGCSTDAYNELIETRWSSFKDVQGVLNALKEMDVNAVPANNRTHQLVDQLRRDVGKDGYVVQNSTSKLLTDIDETLARIVGGKDVKFTGLGAWKKNMELEDDEGFDDWSKLDLLKFNPKVAQRPSSSHGSKRYDI